MNSNQHPNSLSRIFPNKQVALAVELLLLFSAGILAAVLHQKLKIPMHLPGKQGILFLLIIISAARASRIPFGATLATTGAAMFFYVFAFDGTDPYKPLFYLLVAGMIDVLIHWQRTKKITVFLFILLTGAAWTIIPLIRTVVTLTTGIPFKSFMSGFAYPFVTHLLFGMLAAALAMVTLRLFKK